MFIVGGSLLIVVYQMFGVLCFCVCCLLFVVLFVVCGLVFVVRLLLFAPRCLMLADSY